MPKSWLFDATIMMHLVLRGLRSRCWLNLSGLSRPSSRTRWTNPAFPGHRRWDTNITTACCPVAVGFGVPFTVIDRPLTSLTLPRIGDLQDVSPQWPHSCASAGVTTMPVRTASFSALWGSSAAAQWDKAVSEAERIVGYPTSFMSLRCLLSDELSNVAMQMHKLVGTGHPLLKTARKLFNDGKHSMQTRGLLVLLIAKTAGPCVINGEESQENMVSGIYPSQRSLAEITEMVNTAFLIHRGVVDLVSMEGDEAHVDNLEFGNKIAVLSGDFILANVSTSLAELHNTYAVELIASAIADLSSAQFTALCNQDGMPLLPSGGATLEDWERQTYLMSGCLIAKSCQAAVLLAHHPQDLQNKAYVFGKNIAYARQLSEELRALNSDSEDLEAFNVTSAPVIVHLSQSRQDTAFAQLLGNNKVEIKKLRKVLRRSPAIKECKQLCQDYGQKALHALSAFPECDAKVALQNIVKAVTSV